MSQQGYRKPLLLALAGTVVLTAAVYAYGHYFHHSKAQSQRTTALHRSNAIRRPRHRRRWRHGFEHITLDHDPTERAIGHLEERNERREGYGEYQNKWFFPLPEDSQEVDLTLIPCNLRSIYVYLLQHSPAPLSPYQQDCLRLHIHGVFTQNFLREEFPEGYIIGDDAYNVARGLELLDVAEEIVFEVVKAFDEGDFHLSEEWSPLDAPIQSPRIPAAATDGAAEDFAPQDALEALANPTREDDNESEFSYRNNNSSNYDDDPEGSQNMLDLLYHVAGEQARREGYIHRGVECNSCGVHPIQGIRYHCANCFDFDLCESCEATSTHTKSHVFFKIRIPAPSRGNIKEVIPTWYPGKPNLFPTSLPKDISRPLLEQTGMDRTEMDALYEQFKCLAGNFYPTDPIGLGMAIDRKAFDAYFIPSTADRPAPTNLIYDRIFAFYDTNNDGLIGFDEYVRGLARLQDKSRYARLMRIFDGYDLDADGYVDRKDFLRIFRAYFALSKELGREMINEQEDFGYVEEELRDVVRGSQPISAAFGGGTLYGHESRTGQDKQRQANGDLELSPGSAGVLQPDSDMQGDRERAIGNVAMNNRTRNNPFRSFRTEPAQDEPLMLLPIGSNFNHAAIVDMDDATEEELAGPDPPLQTYGWPPILTPEPQDIVDALGQEVPLEDITDPVDRSRVLFAQSQRFDNEGDEEEKSLRARAVEERWRRRQFYLDEEEGLTKPPGYTEPDSSDEEATVSRPKKPSRVTGARPRRTSIQSRSSSKVRFDDSAIDTDYETRSNASSRSIPINERWGGYELGQPEVDVGKDILYQAVQQGFNELLDALFKEKEDECLEAQSTRDDRQKFRKEMEKFKERLETAQQQEDENWLREADTLRTEELLQSTQTSSQPERRNEASSEQEASPVPDVEDHIELMFGNSSATANESRDAEQQAGQSKDFFDPTLPQFRPNEVEVSHPEPPSDPFSGDPAEARALYDLWTRHDEIDLEAQHRGGYGKLSFAEFRRKMVPEDEIGRALGTKGKENGEDGDQRTWESSADLGRLAFVGTWLEMASF
ncbi:hypothetical protein HRR83_003270 [Exophiala dermatitidis]|uniref:Uncharacterized protein n=1 Tax=Exophiala dermatitidis TaxID=5970 RepID=A0AAN6IV85_EXODE|nr:hypothetical protein HRR74_004572 [Exophiala dermatitidis]KAJ4521175.1 hypothetical protein HRR73_003516 [Exophiala dermatitidis]KAJ4547764.1 hypothetical protein HRR76_000390 [Exophiala dermatitidis]KAJ4553702.1 hypothetical protein HRR77_002079 [Exophiala dermatitidis]KAJ4580322.1 hypothetical protein HRR81_002486 [Exophiala dermatitidis]